MKELLRFLASLTRGEIILLRDRARLAKVAAQSHGIRIDPRAVINIGKNCKLEVSRNVSIGAFSTVIMQNDPHSNSEAETRFSIGSGTYIGEYNNIRVTAPSAIGEKCLISQGVSIITSNHSTRMGPYMADQQWRTDKVGVQIGNDVWIGTNAVLLPGVSVGDGAVIAAGSIVNKSVAPYSIVAGIPAQFIRTR